MLPPISQAAPAVVEGLQGRGHPIHLAFECSIERHDRGYRSMPIPDGLQHVADGGITGAERRIAPVAPSSVGQVHVRDAARVFLEERDRRAVSGRFPDADVDPDACRGTEREHALDDFRARTLLALKPHRHLVPRCQGVESHGAFDCRLGQQHARAERPGDLESKLHFVIREAAEAVPAQPVDTHAAVGKPASHTGERIA